MHTHIFFEMLVLMVQAGCGGERPCGTNRDVLGPRPGARLSSLYLHPGPACSHGNHYPHRPVTPGKLCRGEPVLTALPQRGCSCVSPRGSRLPSGGQSLGSGPCICDQDSGPAWVQRGLEVSFLVDLQCPVRAGGHPG